MKIVILGPQARFDADMPFLRQQELVFCDREIGEEALLSAAGDADILFVDTMTRVSASLIAQMPKLKLIHSEGVGYDRIDLDAAKARGIYVCNNRGCNAGAVAEQTVMLMLMLLRRGLDGDRAVREGRQMDMKKACMLQGLTELSDCRVGLIGFGDIAKATAERLAPFGCEVFYNSRRRRTREEEERYGVTYLTLETLASTCDVVSLHCALTEETRGTVNGAFLARMKPTAYLINTARGELVDSAALREALLAGGIAGAGLDTLVPEPTPASHLLVDLPAAARDKVVLSPHLGGITQASFRRAHLHMWRNAERVVDGHKPDQIVNGLD
ncbi:MAG: NAD(P)-dependent oxidoreductase [Oscillibacter sp.]